MQTLAEEWKKRDKEREMIFQRKVDEYSKLEEQLRSVSFLSEFYKCRGASFKCYEVFDLKTIEVVGKPRDCEWYIF